VHNTSRDVLNAQSVYSIKQIKCYKLSIGTPGTFLPALENRESQNDRCEFESRFGRGIQYLRNKSWKPECVLSFNMGWRK